MRNLFVKLAYSDVDSRIVFTMLEQDTNVSQQSSKLELHFEDLEDFSNIMQMVDKPDRLDDQFVGFHKEPNELLFVSLAGFPPETVPDELSDEELAVITNAIKIMTVILGVGLERGLD